MLTAAIEAAAAARPIVTTDVPGCREVVTHGLNGLLVPVRNPRALADALAELVHNPAQRQRMGHASRKRAECEWSQRSVAHATLAIYEELLHSTHA